MYFILDVLRTRNLARIFASEANDESRMCFFQRIFTDTAAENAAAGQQLSTLSISERKLRQKSNRWQCKRAGSAFKKISYPAVKESEKSEHQC